MGWFADLFKSSLTKLIENGSDQELEEEYERRRKTEFLEKGWKTPEMRRIENEMMRRSEEQRKKEGKTPGNPNHRWTDANRWERD